MSTSLSHIEYETGAKISPYEKGDIVCIFPHGVKHIDKRGKPQGIGVILYVHKGQKNSDCIYSVRDDKGRVSKWEHDQLWPSTDEQRENCLRRILRDNSFKR